MKFIGFATEYNQNYLDYADRLKTIIVDCLQKYSIFAFV